MFTTRTPALRTLARRAVRPATFSATPARRYASSLGHFTSASSDLPWLIGAVVFTVPASYYLLSTGSSTSHHTDPSKKIDTGSSSAGQTEPPEHHGEVELPHNKHEGEGKAKEATGAVKEATGKAGEKSSGVAGQAKDSEEDVKDSAEDKAEGATKNAKETAESPNGEKEGKETSVNPQKVDPGDDTVKDAGGPGTISGKQQGISNDDTSHTILHEPRGEAISKKAEGVHNSSKLKGTVDVNRPAK